MDNKKIKISIFYFSSSGNTYKFLKFTEKIIRNTFDEIYKNRIDTNYEKNFKNKTINNIIIDDNNKNNINLSKNNKKKNIFINPEFSYFNIEDLEFVKYTYNYHKKINSHKISNYINKSILSKNKNLDNFYKKIHNILENTDIIILAFPVFFYQAPKILYIFLELINSLPHLKTFNKTSSHEKSIFNSIPLILLSTNGGEPGNSFYKIYKKFRLENIIYSYSMHFEDNHPSLRQKFNPLISKGYPPKRNLLLFRKEIKNLFINIFTFYSNHYNLFKIEEKGNINLKLIDFLYSNKLIKKPVFLPYLLFLELINLFHTKKILFNFINSKKVNVNKCINCELCVKNCPTGSLFFDGINRFEQSFYDKSENNENKIGFYYKNNIKEDKNKNINKSNKNSLKPIGGKIQFDINRCIGCYRCVNICPINAINTHISKWGIKYKRYIKFITKQ